MKKMRCSANDRDIGVDLLKETTNDGREVQHSKTNCVWVLNEVQTSDSNCNDTEADFGNVNENCDANMQITCLQQWEDNRIVTDVKPNRNIKQ